jgi:hypothetical protein
METRQKAERWTVIYPVILIALSFWVAYGCIK